MYRKGVSSMPLAEPGVPNLVHTEDPVCRSRARVGAAAGFGSDLLRPRNVVRELDSDSDSDAAGPRARGSALHRRNHGLGGRGDLSPRSRHRSEREGDQVGRTALFYAAANGHPAVVKLLLDRGAKVDLRDDEGLTALMLTANTRLLHPGAERTDSPGFEEAVEILLKSGADVKLASKDGVTALISPRCRGTPSLRCVSSSGGPRSMRHRALASRS